MATDTAAAVLAGALGALAVLPTLVRLIRHVASARSRDFSHVPLMGRQLATLVFLSLVVVAAYLSVPWVRSSFDFGPEKSIATTFGTAFVLYVLVYAFNRTGYRLSIDAETGIIAWTFLLRPWWPRNSSCRFIDTAGSLHYDGAKHMDLFGISKLQEQRTGHHNGQHTSSGHFPTKSLHKIVSAFDEYKSAFYRHDTEERRQFRAEIRERMRSSLEAGQSKKRERSKRAALQAQERRNAAAHAKREAEEAKRAQRRSKLEEKFRE